MDCLIVIILIVLLIACVIIRKKCAGLTIGSVTDVVTICIITLTGIFTVISILLVIILHDNDKAFDKNYNEIIYYIETYDIEKDSDLTVLNSILNSSSIINKHITMTKKNKDNLFIGCFYTDEIADYDYISTTTLKEQINK